MARQMVLESLARAVATTEPSDPKGLVDIRDLFEAFKGETGEALPEALFAACDKALDCITSLLWQEAENPQETYDLIQATVSFAQEVIETVGSGGNADGIRSPFGEGEAGPGAAPAGESIDPELLGMFVSGCQETLEELEGKILAQETNEGDEENLASIRRHIHTIKGECGVLSLGTAQRLCHVAEDLIDLCTDHQRNLPSDLLLALVDWLKGYITDLGADPNTPAPEHGSLENLLNEAKAAFDEGAPAALAPAEPPPEPQPAAELAPEPTPAPAPAPAAAAKLAPTPAPAPAPAPAAQLAPAPEPPPAAAPEEDPLAGIDPTALVEFPADCLDDPMIPEVLSEGRQHLEDAEAAMLELEANPEDSELIDRIFRAFHTIKGVAGFMNLKTIVQVAHKAETLLDDFRKGHQACTADHLNLIFESRDAMQNLLDCLDGGPPPLLRNIIILTVRLNAATVGETGKQAVILSKESFGSEDVIPAAAPALREASAASASEDLSASSASPESATDMPVASAAGGATAKGRANTRVEHTVKVGTMRLDSLVDMVGELVIAQQMVTQDPDIAGISTERLTRNLGQVAKITRDLQEAAMSLRMVPLRSTFQKMARLVRDLSRKNGKKVLLTIVGEDTELDRTVVEEIGDPLVHLIRNALDHGLEAPNERLDARKPPEGNLELRAFHQGGSIVIEIADDGRGLNREKILAKAVERGLIASDSNLDEIPDGDVWKLIFQPGFSTADKVTDISGRGVGMDVVRKNIESMRGKIDIVSKTGKGSTFTLRLPLTLAIIDGMIVRVGSNRYVVPTLAIEQSFRPTNERLQTVFERGEMAMVRGALLPVRRLKELFSLTEGVENPGEGILLVLEITGTRLCLLVDEILGQHQVVIKSIGKALPKIQGVSGGAILGDGHVALIIDVDGLVEESAHAAV